MSGYQALILSGELVKLLFVFSLGACVGSLTNVLVYRMPRGLSVITPPSRCPKCRTRLGWRENIPIIGWIALRGRCRHCGVAISIEYPLVELIGALLFALPFALWFTLPQLALVGFETRWLGVDWASLAPEWASAGRGLIHMWPVMLVHLTLLGCLLGATIIDARTFMIPLVLTWIPASSAVVIYPLTAAWHAQVMGGRSWRFADGWTWAIATPGADQWNWIGGSIGAVLGLGGSLLLLRLGLIRRSFHDYDAWERRALIEQGIDPDAQEAETDADADARGQGGWRWIWAIVIVLACAVGGGLAAPSFGWIPAAGVGLGLLIGPMPAGVLWRFGETSERGTNEEDNESPASMWLAYPHARRETLRELAFLGLPALLGLAGWVLIPNLIAGQPTETPQAAPLWLVVLSGVCLGYLVGGGVVWAVRILGTLAFGREAMGMGDVHLMAGVGACLGWIDPVLAFFLAAFVALYLVLVGTIAAGQGRRAMPFGPALAAATVLVLLGKPWIEAGLNAWLGRSAPETMIDLP